MRHLWHRELSYCLHISCTCNTFWKARPPKKASIYIPLNCFAFGMNLAKLSFLKYLRRKVENRSYIFSTSYLILSALHTGIREIQEKGKKSSVVYIWHQPTERIFTECSLCDRHKVRSLQASPHLPSDDPVRQILFLSLLYKWGKWDLGKSGDLLLCQTILEVDPGSKSRPILSRTWAPMLLKTEWL